jgi:hypothetical protein
MEFLFLEIRKQVVRVFILTLLQISVCIHIYAQTEPIGSCATYISKVYIVKGTIFNPRTPAENKPYAIKYCDTYDRIYYLEGLKLSEKKYFEIGIKRNDFIKNKLEFANEYKNNDTTSCVELIDLFVSVSIPIKLNGKELNCEDREKILKNIPSGELFRIRRKKPFLGKAVIEIATM